MASNTNPFYMRNVDPDVAVFPDTVPPPYEEQDRGNPPPINYAEYRLSGDGLASKAQITQDGRIEVSLNLRKKLPQLPKDWALSVEEFAVDATSYRNVPKLSIVIMIVGSRGDVQPYIALGRALVTYGHRVRIATHEAFRSFVTDEGLKFFNIGGDPHDLMSYMVRNPGLIPGIESLTNGDIRRKKKMVKEMLNGCWRACVDRDEETGDVFIAEAIISNPPAFAHIHCAQSLGIPLHMSFTMPWTPTTKFPHPLVNVNHSNASNDLTNYLSYAMADLLTWQGLGDVINKFRTKTLGLEPLSLRSGPGVLDKVKVPWTYCMSPSLVPKPNDWKNHIDIVGFYFLEQGGSYQPPDELTKFLMKGEAPIYIGFGSVPVDNPKKMTELIFEAVVRAGVRALISVGWGGLGGVEVPSSIFIIEKPVPHDWLFRNVFAVCHHGGAGTTAIGLKMGRPTIVVPFFGDQPWWGHQVALRGAGPEPIPHKQLTVEKLVRAIEFAQRPTSLEAAKRMGEDIRREDGVAADVILIRPDWRFGGPQNTYEFFAVASKDLDIGMKCLKLSAFAAQALSEKNLIDMNKLVLHRIKEYDLHRNVTDPISGGVMAALWTITEFTSGIAKIFYKPVEGIIMTTVAIPQSVVHIVSMVQEGLHNAPGLYGSEVRKLGKVTGFGSGLLEGGKEFVLSYYDSITGIIVEPVRGARKDGTIGVVKGVVRSYINLATRPAAGAIGLITLPVEGAWKSMQKLWSQAKTLAIRRARVVDGLQQVPQATTAALDELAAKFKVEKKKTKARKKALAERAAKIIEADIRAQVPVEARDRPGSSSSHPSVETDTDTTAVGITPSNSLEERELPPIPPPKVQPLRVPVDSDSDDEERHVSDEENFVKDLEEDVRRSRQSKEAESRTSSQGEDLNA